LGDSALAVDILVALINTLGLTELVSDALASRKQKEAETNAKIVDLFKEALDEIKNCLCEASIDYCETRLVHCDGFARALPADGGLFRVEG
jgi:hypothetical protein